jgi:Ca2+-transporting ATPase
LTEVYLFLGIASPLPTPGGGDFGIGQEQIVSISRDQNIGALQELGGVCLCFS